MRVMGLDLSTAATPTNSRTGWAVIDEKGLVSCGRFPTDTRGWLKNSSEERTLMIASEILRVVQDLEPAWIYAESAFVQWVKAATPLLILRGAVMYACSLAGRTVNPISPSSWRKAIGAGSVRGKENGIAVVQGWLVTQGLPFGHYSEDEIEAIGIAMGGREELRKAGCEI